MFRPACTWLCRIRPLDSTWVMLAREGSGLMRSRGALTFRPRRRCVPVMCMTLTFTAMIPDTWREMPALTMWRCGITRPDASW